jgi:hypothetical protein
MRMHNRIPLGCSLLLLAGTVNYGQTLEARAKLTATLTLTIPINSVQTLKAGLKHFTAYSTETNRMSAFFNITAHDLWDSYLCGALFLTEVYTRGCHWFPRVFTPSTG